MNDEGFGQNLEAAGDPGFLPGLNQHELTVQFFQAWIFGPPLNQRDG
jgi:hypothetical protein